MVNGRADVLAGIAGHIEDVINALAERGHEVWIVTGEGIWTDRLRDRGFTVVVIDSMGRAIDPRADAASGAALLGHVRRQRPDVLALHGAKAGALGRLVGVLTRTPVTYTPHAWAFDDGVPEAEAKRYRVLERGLARLPGRILAVSEREREVGLAAGVGRPQQYEVIHNGVGDVDASCGADPTGQPPTVLMVARFEPQKDHDTLLRALATVTDLAWTCQLAGSGPRRAELEALSADLGLSDRVQFLGHVQDMPALLASSQVFAMLSHWESFPLSILEAMRAGLPCLVSDVGGNSEAVTEGVSGHLVPAADVAQAGVALRRLFSDPSHRQALGQAGRQRFEADFKAEAMVSRLEQVYLRLAAQ